MGCIGKTIVRGAVLTALVGGAAVVVAGPETAERHRKEWAFSFRLGPALGNEDIARVLERPGGRLQDANHLDVGAVERDGAADNRAVLAESRGPERVVEHRNVRCRYCLRR